MNIFRKRSALKGTPKGYLDISLDLVNPAGTGQQYQLSIAVDQSGETKTDMKVCANAAEAYRVAENLALLAHNNSYSVTQVVNSINAGQDANKWWYLAGKRD